MRQSIGTKYQLNCVCTDRTVRKLKIPLAIVRPDFCEESKFSKYTFGIKFVIENSACDG